MPLDDESLLLTISTKKLPFHLKRSFLNSEFYLSSIANSRFFRCSSKIPFIQQVLYNHLNHLDSHLSLGHLDIRINNITLTINTPHCNYLPFTQLLQSDYHFYSLCFYFFDVKLSCDFLFPVIGVVLSFQAILPF